MQNLFQMCWGGVANDKTVDEIEVGEEVNPEAQKEAGEEDSTEAAITNVEITIGGAKNGEKTEIVNPTALPNRIEEGNTDINLEAQVDFDIPEGTKQGKTFDFVVSDNVNLHGVLESEKKGESVFFDGEEIATAEKLTDGRNGYKYTFNEKVDGLKDIRVRIIYPLFIDPDKVPMGTKEYEIGEDGKYVLDEDGNPILKADNKEKVSVTVGGVTASKDYTVEYESEVFDIKSTGSTLSGIADIDKVNDNNYNHTIYVNPTADQMLNGSHVTVQNEKGYNTITFDDDVKNSVKVYKVKDPNKLPLSFGNDFNDGNYEDVTSKANVKLVNDANNADLKKLVVDVNQGNTNQSQPFDDKDYDKSTYVITYTGKRTHNKAFKTNTIFTADWRKANGNVKNLSKLGDQSWEWTNEIVIDDADAIAIANKTYSLGDRVWIDADEDGSQGDKETGLEGVKVILKGINMSDKETTTDASGKYIFKELRNGEYTVEFEIPTGYKPTTANKDGVTDENNSDASVAQGATVATATGAIDGKDNLNVDFGVIKEAKGSFKETHVYKTLDFEGNVLKDKTITEQKTATEGTKDESYTSEKVDKDGYEFTKVTADQGSDEVKISEDGKSVQSGNYVEDKELAVTYEYVKQPGRFKEKHIYKTLDVDGNEIKSETKVIDKKDDGNPIEGYINEKITTAQKPDGYTFESETDIKLQDGSSQETYTNYVAGKTLEKTYVYYKKQGTFEEEHIYKTLNFDGSVKETSTENPADKKVVGFKEAEYKTKANEKDGFVLVSVQSEENAVIDSENGTEKSGNIVEGKKLKATYTYEKRPGRFKETHIYQTVDKTGKVISEDKTVYVPDEKGKPIEGFSNQSFTTSAKPEGEYEYKSTLSNIPSSNNFVPGETVVASYVYQKTKEEPTPEPEPTPTPEPTPEPEPTPVDKIEKTGEFQEHHIYIVKDKDGNEIRREVVHGDVKKGKKTETYTTEKKEKDGFKFIKTQDPKNNPVYKEDGSKAEGNFEEDLKKEITYIYEKIEKSITPTPEETPVEEPKEDPAPKHEEEKPAPKEEPKTEEPKEEETPEETPVEEPKEEEKEVVIEKEEDDEADKSKDNTPKHEGKEDYSKAPQTGVAGAAGYLGLAGLGTALLAALEDKKKKKNK